MVLKVKGLARQARAWEMLEVRKMSRALLEQSSGCPQADLGSVPWPRDQHLRKDGSGECFSPGCTANPLCASNSFLFAAANLELMMC